MLGNRVFQANFTTGLRVLEFGDLANRELMEIAFFDTFPENNSIGDDALIEIGAWSVYPYLPSGNIIVSDFTTGLFILSASEPESNAASAVIMDLLLDDNP